MTDALIAVTHCFVCSRWEVVWRFSDSYSHAHCSFAKYSHFCSCWSQMSPPPLPWTVNTPSLNMKYPYQMSHFLEQQIPLSNVTLPWTVNTPLKCHTPTSLNSEHPSRIPTDTSLNNEHPSQTFEMFDPIEYTCTWSCMYEKVMLQRTFKYIIVFVLYFTLLYIKFLLIYSTDRAKVHTTYANLSLCY